MAYTTIDNPTDYFNTVLYTGNETARDITTGLTSTDWVWIKRRDGTANHRIFDVVRGVHENLQSNTSNAEQNNTQSLTAFGTSTFSLGTDSGGYDVNTNSQTYVSWNWSAGGSASSNSNGSITSSVSANTTAGFSIVGYTGTGANASVGHGLGTAPDCIIVKRREDAGRGWWVYHKDLGATKAIYLHDTAASFTNDWLQDTAPTNSVFTLDNNGDTNGSSKTHIAYCFVEKKGYSKFGSYTGNGSTDGTFVYTGFKPAWVMTKRTSSSATGWVLMDNKRETFNDGATNYLIANTSVAETDSSFAVDFLSNGFKPRTNSGGTNTSGATYIFMAFAEAPFVSSGGIPTTAR